MNCPISLELRHPLLRPQHPIVTTPPIEHVANLLVTNIEASLNGMRLDGNTRRGKTNALERLGQTESWRPFPMSFFHVHFGKHKVTTETYFFTTLLACARMKFTSAVSVPQHLGRVATHMASEADKVGADIIIMPVDESQRLLLEDYEHLHTLHNALHLLGKRLFVVLIMQIDYIGDECEAILDDLPRHAKARFLRAHEAFIPVYRWRELAAYFEQYDENETWPKGSRITHTQHFAPKAYAAGWRARYQAKEMWTIAEGQLELFGLKANAWAWPMETLEPFAAYLLTHVAGRNPDFTSFTGDHIRAALAHAKFIEFERDFPASLDPQTYVIGQRLEKYEEPK